MVVHIIDFSNAVVGSNSNNNKLNPFGAPLRRHVGRELQAAQANPAITSIVLTGGRNRNFSAGADLNELVNVTNKKTNLLVAGTNHDDDDATAPTPSLLDLVQAIEACDKPIVAGLEGVCLGGGLEVALACHYRVASAATQLGLPEVHVGLIPGAGGTQRLPRLVGLAAALNLILTGQAVSATQALSLKLIDAVVENISNNNNNNDSSQVSLLLSTALQWAEWAEVLPLEPRRCLAALSSRFYDAAGRPLQGTAGRRAAWEACRAAVTSGHDLAQGQRRETELFLETLTSAEGRARRHAFFAVRRAQKSILASSSTTTRPTNAQQQQQHPLLQKNVSHVRTAVIGAGTMGAGIALVLLRAGFAVTLVDVQESALQTGVERIHRMAKKWAARRSKKAASDTSSSSSMLERLSATTQLRDLHDCQLVVEAVVENMKVKQSIFRALDEITARRQPDCLLLSNTSTLDIDTMASVLQKPSFFAGWHFFSPAHVMPLVEIVVGRHTQESTVALLQALTKRLGKIGVVVGNCHGFCGNRLLQPYSFEMLAVLVENGNSVQDIDCALRDHFGMAMGPFAMADLAGNDISYNIRREQGWVRSGSDGTTTTTTSSSTSRPSRYSELADDMVTKLGRLGQKVGKGWYDYNNSENGGDGRTPRPSPEVTEFCRRYLVVTHPEKRPLSAVEIVERLLYPLVNEGFKCLEEGVVRCPSDIDVVYLHGYGWPAWRGGPMYWADHDVGLDVLLKKLWEFQTEFPDTEHFVPSRLLVECVEANMTVQEYYQQKQPAATRSKL